jgi:glycosyltransferase involved in cell wall biosynthesis
MRDEIETGAVPSSAGSDIKISIVTVVLDSVSTIEDCLKSVRSQTHRAIEHIVIDGGSTDGTLDVLERYRDGLAVLRSGPDAGLYDAMNKGIDLATGDVLGILNADDILAGDSVLAHVCGTLAGSGAETCYGDLIYVGRDDTDKMIRYWRAGGFRRERFARGWMPPHPTFFARRTVYGKYGGFNLSFPLAADYELMLRFLYRHGLSAAYIPRALVRMRSGGLSRPGTATLKMAVENYRAWKVNGLKYPPAVLLKPLTKMTQWRKRLDEA